MCSSDLPTAPALRLTVDTAAIAVADLGWTTDTGSSSTDLITSTNVPVFTGTAEPGSTVELVEKIVIADPWGGSGSENFVVIGTATADGSGNFSVSPGSALSDGEHGLGVRVIDVAGNVGSPTAPALRLTVDTAAPIAVADLGWTTDTGSSSTDLITSKIGRAHV